MPNKKSTQKRSLMDGVLTLSRTLGLDPRSMRDYGLEEDYLLNAEFFTPGNYTQARLMEDLATLNARAKAVQHDLESTRRVLVDREVDLSYDGAEHRREVEKLTSEMLANIAHLKAERERDAAHSQS